ncbi:MAG: DevR family CRISPR-associated autoregulator [Ignisphaera sp.]
MASNLKLYVLARVELQLESLNASGAVGNYTKLQEGYVVIDNELIPVPVIDGNALKNWHARAMAEKYVELGGENIHDVHYKDMYRLPREVAEKDVEQSCKQNKCSRMDSEKAIINACAICDLHGLLIAEPKTPEHLQIKRESLVKFSFAVPIEEIVSKSLSASRTLKYVVTHNRVTPESERMMVFKREYASAIWGWQAVIDIASIGRSQLEKDKKDKKRSMWQGVLLVENGDEIVRRAKSAILAFENVLMGTLGASTSRALPISRPVELIAILVQGCVPTPLHPYYTEYKDYLAKYIALYFDKIKEVYSMNVDLENKVTEVMSRLSQEEGSNQKLSEEEIRKNVNEKIKKYGDHYKLIEDLAKSVEKKIKPDKNPEGQHLLQEI